MSGCAEKRFCVTMKSDRQRAALSAKCRWLGQTGARRKQITSHKRTPTHLDLVHITDGVVELHRPPLLQHSLRVADVGVLLAWQWGASRGHTRTQTGTSRSGDRILQRTKATLLLLVHCLLLLLPRRLHRRQVLRLLTLRGRSDRTPTRTESHLGALLAWLRSVCAIGASERLCVALLAQRPLRWHLVEAHAHRRRDPNGVRVVICAALDAIARRQERVKSLDQIWISGEEGTDSTNHPRRVDGAALEVLHDVEETVVHVWLVRKLHLHLVEIGQCVVQDRLLALALTLTLLGLLWRLLLRSLLRLRPRCEGHEHPLLHLLPTRSLGLTRRLDCTTREDVLRTAWRTHRYLWLWLWSSWKRVVQHAVRSQRGSRSHGHRLMQGHGRARRTLMRRRLLEALSLLLLAAPVLLFLDLDLLLLSRSLAFSLCQTRLPGRVTEARQWKSWAVRSRCRRLWLSGGRLAQAGDAGKRRGRLLGEVWKRASSAGRGQVGMCLILRWGLLTSVRRAKLDPTSFEAEVRKARWGDE